MRHFETEVQQLKYRVVKELVQHVKSGRENTIFYDIPLAIAPGPEATMRCCIYKERAIVQERLKNALNEPQKGDLSVQVIDIACDECPAEQFNVTGACRGCLAHMCMHACPVEAIKIVDKKAVIDKSKCVECGKCMSACPYNAITEHVRPCMKGCKPAAITIDENKKAKIDPNKCIECGACVYNCPFGAIVDVSYVLRALKILRDSNKGANYKVVAAVAPSIAGQFDYANIEQVTSGLKDLGFDEVAEVALEADIVAAKEAEELQTKGFLTSSCCPPFVKYIEMNFPSLKKFISEIPSPMMELSKLIKADNDNAKVIFIGPCIAKKQEFSQEKYDGVVDCVLTFTELQAMFDGMGVKLEELSGEPLAKASKYGRKFAVSGGLTEAVNHAIAEANLPVQADSEICNGIDQCRIALLKAARGKLGKNYIEGMVCEGGCVNGPASLHHGAGMRKNAGRFE